MRIKFLKVRFESFEDFKTRTTKTLDAAVRTGKKSIQRKDTLIWSSVEAYQQFMSDQKYTILAAIYKHHPGSVYQLAKVLNRAQQNVARDCDMLAMHGFIKFDEKAGGRKTKIPKLAFDYNAILVQLPSLSYKVAFENEAA